MNPKKTKRKTKDPPDFFSTTLKLEEDEVTNIYRILIELHGITNIPKMSVTGQPFSRNLTGLFHVTPSGFLISSDRPALICSTLQFPWGSHSHPARSEDTNTASLHLELGGDAHSQRSPASAPNPRPSRVNWPGIRTGGNLPIRLTFLRILSERQGRLSVPEAVI